MVAALLAAACTGGDGGDGREPARRSPGTTAGSAEAPTSVAVERPRGGTARVAVWELPDVGAATLAGAAVRALVLPQLFVAGPDGSWSPSLAEPGSARLAADQRSASFRIRPGAAWSNGAPITVDDLRRSMDTRFVAAVDGPTAGGVVTVRFTQALPGWRRLWSGADSVSAPGAGIWGGPFVVAGSTPGLDVVLRRNDRWYGRPGPFLDEVRLVLVPDPVTARQLLEREELDVVMPLAMTHRTPQLAKLSGVRVDVGREGGWWTGLVLNPAQVDEGERRALVAAFDRAAFVGALLRGEAAVLDGFAGPADGVWSAVGPGDAGGLRGRELVLTAPLEDPMTALLQRAVQKRVRAAGGTLELRNAESHRVEGWVDRGEYEAAVVVDYDGPEPCWTCRWGGVDAGLAAAADAGDRAAAVRLEERLRDGALLLPLWRPRPLVAWRDGLHGVVANGYGLSAAWNAWEWWRER